MAIDQELNKLKVSQAAQQLEYVKALFPSELFAKDQDSINMLLILKRIFFKAKLVADHLQQAYKLNQLSFNLVNDVDLEFENEV